MLPGEPIFTTAALRAVGRNVLDFQRLEKILKDLTLRAPISEPIEKIEAVMESRRGKIARMPLGAAVKAWIGATSNPHVQQTEPVCADEIVVTFWFDSSALKRNLEERAAELNALAVERNALIHQELTQVDFTSEFECRALIERLDAQNVRLRKQIEELGRILEQHRTLSDWLNSDEGQSEIQKLLKDAD